LCLVHMQKKFLLLIPENCLSTVRPNRKPVSTAKGKSKKVCIHVKYRRRREWEGERKKIARGMYPYLYLAVIEFCRRSIRCREFSREQQRSRCLSEGKSMKNYV